MTRDPQGDSSRAANLFILTGAPGSGKTTILDNIGSDIRCVGEPAREILEEQRASDGAGTPDRDPSMFVELLLRRSIDKHEAAQRGEGSVMFDRGLPDCVAYAALMGTDPTPSVRASEQYRYHSEVLVLEPWEEIYTVDDERTMSFADTFAFHEALIDAYERVRYTLVEVPRGTVESRASFVRNFILPRGRRRRFSQTSMP
jgi:predicted ATPase